MATAKKNTKTTKTPNGTQENATMTELFNPMMDPAQVMKLQRQAATAAFDGALQVHEETRKMAEKAWDHSLGELDAWMEPWRKAGQEMQAAGFDLHKRAIEVSKSETDRLFDTFSE